MTQEHKNLLMKDLCGRLPYGVKCYGFQMKIDGNDNECYGVLKNISDSASGWKFMLDDRVPLNNRKCYEEVYHEVKPYLFPLSSMTIEKKGECPCGWSMIDAWIDGSIYLFEDEELNIDEIINLLDWLNKNHFDYRGLIEKGLAIDCSNLNIYDTRI